MVDFSGILSTSKISAITVEIEFPMAIQTEMVINAAIRWENKIYRYDLFSKLLMNTTNHNPIPITANIMLYINASKKEIENLKLPKKNRTTKWIRDIIAQINK